ncbi:carbon-nitrogen hydrolase family protein [Lentimicrobium sp. S6]|uniref:carbon-nitrogen hydrolase family protein n=1 Tax=Lentimicrobium sp. S6 TaxID=2735872 RepID=UPI0015546945|nr:carbon-nitrogen hydrolase family protein [Lentimicrobium sp. S6]NPD46130.1 carbon-nitrogen hydrolase family protein [Lentimicrobium sp. S6]
MITKKHLPIVYFLLGFGIFMFTRLSNLVPFINIAILIAPIFILRFIRTQPRKKGVWLTLLGFILSMNIALWGLFNFDEVWMTIVFGGIRSTLLAIIWFLPFMMDRLIYPRYKNKGIISTLIFPIVTTAMFYITSLEGPFDDGGGTLSSFSYDYHSLAFNQVRSLFGVWILVFIHSWLYAMVNFLWENEFNWKAIRIPSLVFAMVFVAVFIYGGVKISDNAEKETVKIAAIVLVPEDGEIIPMSRIFDTRTTSPFEETISKIEMLTNKAVGQGAKIVSFQEFAMVIEYKEEDRLKTEYQRIAMESNAFLSITYAYFGDNEKGENKHLFINGKGEILLDYTKRYLLGIGDFGETAVFRKGAEIIQSAETPYGTIGITICKDMGYPSFIRQAGKQGVDIMLNPSYDWPRSSTPWYLTGAIENGFSFVRPSYNGYSYASDYNGKLIAHMNFNETKDGIMYADVPTKGVKVLYPRIGDLLGWTSLIAMFLLIGLIIFTERNLAKTLEPTAQNKNK